MSSYQLMNRYMDRPLKGYDDVNIGEYAILVVEDDGSGISADDLKRIFEPFFTKESAGPKRYRLRPDGCVECRPGPRGLYRCDER